MPSLKFKLADKLSKGFAVFGTVLGIGIEARDSWNEMKKKKKKQFQNVVEEIVQNFNKQRQEYLDFINDNQKFIEQFPSNYLELINRAAEMREEVYKREKFQREFEEWKDQGEIIDSDFETIF